MHEKKQMKKITEIPKRAIMMQGCTSADKNDPAVVEAIMEDMGITKQDLKKKSDTFFGRNQEE